MPERYLASIVPRISREWFAGARWLQRKDAAIDRVALHDWATLSQDEESVVGIAVVAVGFSNGDVFREHADGDLYNIPLLITKSEKPSCGEPLVIAGRPDSYVHVYDATGSRALAAALLGAINEEAVIRSERGHFRFASEGPGTTGSHVHAVVTEDRDTTNTVVMVDSSQVIKVYRRLQPGLSPDIEVSRTLAKAGFRNIPRPLGYGVYLERHGVARPAFFVQEFIENEGDAWDIECEDALEFLTHSDVYKKAFGFRERRLGEVTAGLHWVSSSVKEDGFIPEPMMREDVANLISNISSAIPITIEALRQAGFHRDALTGNQDIYELLRLEEVIAECLRQAEEALSGSHGLGMKIRIHGDLHLGQFLQVRRNKDPDYVVIDFEGEPLRPVGERLQKSSPLRDVAGMLRSFDYSGYSAAFRISNSPREKESLMESAKEWGRQTQERFLEGYLKTMCQSCGFVLPEDPRNFRLLLLCFKLEKALYEIRYELRNRPRWVNIAVRGTLDTINEIQSSLDCRA